MSSPTLGFVYDAIDSGEIMLEYRESKKNEADTFKHHRKYASPTKQRRVGDKGGQAKDPKLTCSVCGKPNAARYYCADCSTDGGSIVAVCGTGTERDCISRHAQGGD